MSRKPYLAGNWKMNLDRRSALELAHALQDGVGASTDRDVAVFPSFVYLDEVARALAGSPIRVGAQNMCDEDSGAFTGEVSADMLLDVGCQTVVLGHSERRHLYGESSELVNNKVLHALAKGLEVVLCVGETQAEREGGTTEQVTGAQTTIGLKGVSAQDMSKVTLAYEPVWAIGTGLTASPAQAGEVHTYLRGVLAGLYDDQTADGIRIQYGGSVKPDNVAELMAVANVDGALVGGASLKADSFLKIIHYR